MKMYRGTVESIDGKPLKHYSGYKTVKGVFVNKPEEGKLFLFHTFTGIADDMGMYISVERCVEDDNVIIFTNTINRKFKLTIEEE